MRRGDFQIDLISIRNRLDRIKGGQNISVAMRKKKGKNSNSPSPSKNLDSHSIPIDASSSFNSASLGNADIGKMDHQSDYFRADSSSDPKPDDEILDTDDDLDDLGCPFYNIASKVTNIDGKVLSSGGIKTSSKVRFDLQLDESVADEKTMEEQPLEVTQPNQLSQVVSYAAMVQAKADKKSVNFRKLEAEEVYADVDIVLPRESVHEVNNRFQNTLVGYFLGKRLAYPIVDNFVKNNWTKYGLVKVMMNGNGFFFFKFNAKAGLNKVLEEGPWMIRSVPLLLNEWSPSLSLKKEEIKNIVVWIKLYDVPMAAYTEDGLSLLASKLGNPRMLDSYTSTMCLESWGRSSFARALIEISADQEFRDDLIVAVPDLDGEGFSKEKIRVEYEWKPPKCKGCCIFGHTDVQCPKQVKVVQQAAQVVVGDGFQEVKKKAKKVIKQKQPLVYRPVSKPSNTNKGSTASKSSNSGAGPSTSKVPTSNQYHLLNDYGDDLGPLLQKNSKPIKLRTPHQDDVDDFDRDVDEHIEIPKDTAVR